MIQPRFRSHGRALFCGNFSRGLRTPGRFRYSTLCIMHHDPASTREGQVRI